jgi:hypothetical protein
VGTILFKSKRLVMTEDPLPPDHFNHVTILDELVCSKGVRTRHFTFETPESKDPFDPYHPELGPKYCVWQVMLGDKGVLFCNHHADNGVALLNKMLIEQPDFTELFKEFDTLRVLLIANGLNPTEPILCWLRGLLHSFMAENPKLD